MSHQNLVSLVLSALGVFAPQSLFSQTVNPPEVEWERTFEGTGWGHSVQQTTDGGFVAVGNCSWDVCLVKTDSLGELIWQKVEVLGAVREIEGFSGQQTTDGGYVVVGHNYYYSSVYLVKINPFGELAWEKTYGGEFSIGRSVQQTTDGGYFVVGTRNGDLYLIKTDSSGELVWEKTFGTVGERTNEEGFFGQQTTDGGYIVVGLKEATLPPDIGSYQVVYLIKTNPFGELVWEKTYGGEHSIGRSVQQTTDGGYIVAGDHINQGYLIKTNPFGELAWEKTYGVPMQNIFHSVQQTADGGYIAAGNYMYFVKTDSSGNEIWSKNLEQRGIYGAYSIQQTTDGGYIAVGNAYDQTECCRAIGIYLIKLSPVGQPLPPNDLSAHLRTSQSAGITWVDNALNETSFILERRLRGLEQGGEGSGGTEDWTQIGEVPANTTMYIDPVLPPNNEATYRIAAKNANGTSSKVLSQPITTPDSRWQLKIYDSTQNKWVDLKKPSQFNPDWGTAVIVHGWNPPDDNLCVFPVPFGICQWDGDINTSKDGKKKHWTLNIAQSINKRITVNILAWDWLEESTGILEDALKNVDTEIYELADSLRKILPTGYSKSIHFMGHSLGTLIAVDTARLMRNSGTPNQKTFSVNQVTLWDPPDQIPFIDYQLLLHDLTDDVSFLRSNGVYVDLYDGVTNKGTHSSSLLVDVPLANTQDFIIAHSVDRWYSTTIPSSYTQTVLDERGCGSPHLPEGLGFGNSVLLPDGERSRIPEFGCSEYGTLMFSKLCKCSDLTRFCQDEIYGLTEKRNCTGIPSPQEKSKNTAVRSIRTKVSGQGGGAQIEELVGEYTEDIFIDPEWDYISLEYDFISAPSPANLEISLVDGETSHPILSINSEVVFNEGFQDIGLRKISELQNQNITLLLELRSSAPDAEVQVRNITFWQDPYHDNSPPIAHAGEDQTLQVGCGETVEITLDGSLTHDPDDTELTYWWTIDDGLLETGVQSTIQLPAGEYLITLMVKDNAENESSDEVKIIINSDPCPFRRGDTNTDKTIDISDAITTLEWLFLGNSNISCKDSADANDSGEIDLSDAIYILGYLFIGSNPQPPEPFMELGFDPTEDSLSCLRY